MVLGDIAVGMFLVDLTYGFDDGRFCINIQAERHIDNSGESYRVFFSKTERWDIIFFKVHNLFYCVADSKKNI